MFIIVINSSSKYSVRNFLKAIISSRISTLQFSLKYECKGHALRACVMALFILQMHDASGRIIRL